MKEEIEKLREKLNKIEGKEERLKLSQELDKLIVEYLMKNYKKNH